MKIIKSLLLITFLLAPIFSFADECEFISKDSELITELTEDCRRNLITDQETIDNVKNSIIGGDLDPSRSIRFVWSGFELAPETSSSTIMLISAIGIIATLVLIGALIGAFLKIATHIWNTAFGKEGMFTKTSFSQVLTKSSFKIFIHFVWIFVVVIVTAKGLDEFAVTYHNVWVVNEKVNGLNPQTYSADKKFKADTAMQANMPEYLKYYACNIDMDKQILRQQFVIADNDVVDFGDKYLQCMQERRGFIEEDKFSYNSAYMHNIKNCAFAHANIGTVKCGGVAKFNSVEQLIHKERLRELESRLIALANEYNKYYCVNQTKTKDQVELKHNCFDYDPNTSSIKVDGNGKIVPIKSAMNWYELQTETKALQAALSLSLQEVATAYFKSFSTSPIKVSFDLFLSSLIMESATVRAAKYHNEQAMDFSFKVVPELRNKEMKSDIKESKNIADGKTRVNSSHYERVADIIDNVNDVSEDEKIRAIIYAGANFLGQDYFQNLGYEYKRGADYNIISNTIVSGIEVSKTFFLTSISLRAAKAAFSMVGSRNFDGKPNLTYIGIENSIGAASDFFWMLAFAIGGAIAAILFALLKTIGDSIIKFAETVFKIAFLADIPFYLEQIDEKYGVKFSYDEIIKRLIMLVYIYLAPRIFLFAFLASFYIAYFCLTVAMQNFFSMNFGLGLFTVNGSSLMAIACNLTVIIMFVLMVMAVTTYAFSWAVNTFNSIALKKFNGSQDNSTNGFLSDMSQLSANTQNAFGQYGKMPRRQRI